MSSSRKNILFLVIIFSFLIACTETQPEEKVVNVFGAFTDQEARKFEGAMKPFTRKTGIKVVYESSREFEEMIFFRVKMDIAPDVAALPQPGIMKRLVEAESLVPLWPEIINKINKNYAPVWKELGTYKGKTYGVFHRVNVKSLVWYPKKAWAKAGYIPPKNWNEMKALMKKMIKDKHTPWTIGVESGAASGWPATDWIEDIVLRTSGPEFYDKWINHDVPFNHPEIKKAVTIMGDIWFSPGNVYGGRKNILKMSYGDAPKVMFVNPPKAWMHRQGNFIRSFFPENVQRNLDNEVGVFGFPSINPKYGTPVLGGGDQFVVLNDRPEVRKFMEFLATWESGIEWAKKGGALFPYKNQDISLYPSQIEQTAAELLVNAKVFRFDASDLMPAKVGTGTFWKEMLSYVDGNSADKVLNEIEKSWEKK